LEPPHAAFWGLTSGTRSPGSPDVDGKDLNLGDCEILSLIYGQPNGHKPGVPAHVLSTILS